MIGARIVSCVHPLDNFTKIISQFSVWAILIRTRFRNNPGKTALEHSNRKISVGQVWPNLSESQFFYMQTDCNQLNGKYLVLSRPSTFLGIDR